MAACFEDGVDTPIPAHPDCIQVQLGNVCVSVLFIFGYERRYKTGARSENNPLLGVQHGKREIRPLEEKNGGQKTQKNKVFVEGGVLM